jgi:hypothetical protein
MITFCLTDLESEKQKKNNKKRKKQRRKKNQRSNELWEIKRTPWIPLEKPYQRGICKILCRQEDVMRSKDGDFLNFEEDQYLYVFRKPPVSEKEKKIWA